MGKIWLRRRLQIWIACFAILLNTLAPSISHALTALQDRAGQVEVCSVTGSKFVAAEPQAPAQSPTDSALHHLEHCPFCGSHAGSFALPATMPSSFAVLGGHDLFPPLFYRSPTPLFSWSRAHPRGPPAIA